ncbi:acetyltransferase [Leeuwenhoekiella sp. LLG6367-2.1]|uniref:acetyltransferase n=1 Tax=Leeuwenhoekiella sp. LLG6367-2.1 TaxID=3160833 RepID=UPI0038651A49
MYKTLAILGAGHLGQQFANYAIADNHYENVVFFDDYTLDIQRDGYSILGGVDDIERYYREGYFHELLIGIGYKHLKKKKELYEHFLNIIPFGKIIHSTAWVDATAHIAQGTVIYPGCFIDAHAEVLDNTVLNIGCTVAHDTIVGKHCFLSPRAALAGFIQIEELCIVGINATLIDNLKIASNTQIGGGCVVISDIVKSGLYVGNPFRFVK